MVYNNILETIGNTPLVRLNRIVEDVPATVYGKLEAFNPGQSAKDRIAYYMVEKAEREGKIKPGATIIEATSGNTGYSLAMVCALKGYKCVLTVSDKASEAKIRMLKALGAKVVLCPASARPEDPDSYYARAEQFLRETPNAYYLSQNWNGDNADAHYHTTGREIWEQTEGKITHYVCCVGTGGTMSGTARYLKEKNPDVKIVGVDAYGSVLKKFWETRIFDEGEIYSYKVEGLGKTIIPDNVDFEVIDEFLKVTDGDSARQCRDLATMEGLLLGYSSGSAMQAVMQIEDLKPTDVVVALFSDHGTRYLDKVYNDGWMREQGFMGQSHSDRRRKPAQSRMRRMYRKYRYYRYYLNKKLTQ